MLSIYRYRSCCSVALRTRECFFWGWVAFRGCLFAKIINMKYIIMAIENGRIFVLQTTNIIKEIDREIERKFAAIALGSLLCLCVHVWVCMYVCMGLRELQ